MEPIEPNDPKFDQLQDNVYDEKKKPWFNPQKSIGVLDTRKKTTTRNKQKGGLEFTVELPKGMMKEVLKFFFKNMIKGNFSLDLPVKLNGPRTVLEQFSLYHAFLPNFIPRILSTSDPLAQVEHFIGNTLSSLNLGWELDEPFQSLVGETYAAHINGYGFYGEVIKKDPQTIIQFIDGQQDFNYQGSVKCEWSLGVNSATIYLYGVQKLFLKKNQHLIKWRYPTLFIDGITSGNYLPYFKDFIYIWSHKANCFCIIEVAPDKGGFFTKRKLPLDEVKGACYQVNKQFLYAFEKLTTDKQRKKYINQCKKLKPLFMIEGQWADTVYVNKKKAYVLSNLKTYEYVRQTKVLPSDTSLRKDLWLRKKGRFQEAQQAADEMKKQRIKDEKAQKATAKKIRKMKKKKK